MGCGYGSNFIASLKRREQQPKEYIHIDSDQRVFNENRRKKFLSKPSYHVNQGFIPYDRTLDQQIIADAKELPLQDNSVHILQMHLIFGDTDMPIEDQEKALREIERVLAPGGYFVSFDEDNKLSKAWHTNAKQDLCLNLERFRKKDYIFYVFKKKKEEPYKS